MATMEKTWQFDINRAHARCGAADTTAISAAWILWYLKAFLMGQIGGATQGLWTMYYSCDSTVAGSANDGVDRWGSTFDSTKVVMATTTGTVRSWCVLKSPVLPNGMQVYLTLCAVGITYNGSAGVGYAQIVFSKVAPSGGTTTADPTLASDAFPLPSDKQYGTVQLIGNVQSPTANFDNGVPHHVHAGLTNDGAEFYLIASKDGTGYAEFGLIFTLLANAKANDLYPFWQMQSFRQVAAGAWHDITIDVWTSQTAVFTNNCRNSTGAIAASTPLVIPRVGNSYLITDSTQAVTSIDPTDQSWFDFPCWVFGGSSASGGAGGYQFKGRLQDFALGPEIAGQGCADATSGSITSALVGCLWTPMNAAPLF